MTTKCHYCENESTKTLVWLKDKRQQEARIKLPWCGCDLQVALRRFWVSPYPVVKGVDYEVEERKKPGLMDWFFGLFKSKQA